MINYKKTYKESTSWRHWRLSCLVLPWKLWDQGFGKDPSQPFGQAFSWKPPLCTGKDFYEEFSIFTFVG